MQLSSALPWLTVWLALAVCCGTNLPSAEGQSGAATARSVGLPVSASTLTAFPDLAHVPVGPPGDTQTNSWKYASTSGASLQVPAARQGAAGARVADLGGPVAPSRPFSPIKTTTGFISVSGRHLVKPDGTPFYFAGTNIYDLALNQSWSYTEQDVLQILTEHWNRGATVVRCWAFSDGLAGTDNPLQNPLGVYHESALMRLDYVIATAGKIGIRLILTLVNFWTDYGGIGFYMDSIAGNHTDPNAFYGNATAQAYYKKYVSTVLNRVNTLTGVPLKADPAVLAWELCNECHTDDNWEINQGLVPGEAVYKWELMMSGYIKNTIGAKGLVTNGNEGWRAKGAYDPNADVSYPYNNWMSSGLKGEDFVRNAGIPTLDFVTIHCYPDAWGIPNSSYSWVNANYIADRANATSKPIILEEYGDLRSYITPRDLLFDSETDAAVAAGYAGSLVWQVKALEFLTGAAAASTDFNYTQAGAPSTLRQYSRMAAMNAGQSWHAPPSPPMPPAAPPPPCTCSDAAPGCSDPTSSGCYTCAQQQQWGKCNETWMAGYCQVTCGTCPCHVGDGKSGAPTKAPTKAPVQSTTAKKITVKPTAKATTTAKVASSRVGGKKATTKKHTIRKTTTKKRKTTRKKKTTTKKKTTKKKTTKKKTAKRKTTKKKTTKRKTTKKKTVKRKFL